MLGLLKYGIELMEQGIVPDTLLRVAIRWLCRQRLTELTGHSPAQGETAQQHFREALAHGPLALATDEANVQHYELPPDYFAIVLGPRRKYSCCFWDEAHDSLAAAEEEALRRVCRQAELANGQRILDLGCGWGSLALWIAENYPQAKVTAVSNSSRQRESIEKAAAARGLTNITVVTLDVGAGTLPTRMGAASFDRIVSVEMLEHIRNTKLLLRQLYQMLAAQGKLYFHHFCHRKYAYAFEVQNESDWLTQYFFRGGIMPQRDLIAQSAERFQLEQQWDWNGIHYQHTALAWLARHDAARDDILQIFRRHYGPQNAKRWYQRWRIFYLAVAELFGYAQGEEWHVTHCRLRKTDSHNPRS